MWTLMLALLLPCTALVELEPLRCRDVERCQFNGTVDKDEHWYNIDGHDFEIMYDEIEGYLSMNCIKSTVLESSAMPRADTELFAWQIVIINCTLPAAGSIVDRLKWLNITLLFDETEKIKKQSMLVLNIVPPTSRLTAEQFQGLERLSSFEIHAFKDDGVTAQRNFLAPFKNVRVLNIQFLKLHVDELNSTRTFLEKLSLHYTNITRLPEMICTSKTIFEITINSDVGLDMGVLPPRLRKLHLSSPATKLQLKSAHALKSISLTNWTETHPQPLANCYNLQQLYLKSPAAHKLPHRWLANCLNLVELVVFEARNLITLPPRLFGIPGPTMKLIAFKNGVLERINEGQFDMDGVGSQLLQLELENNRLNNIPNSTLSLKLQYLDLSFNNLDNSVLETLATNEKLEVLALNNNPRIGSVCDKNGYSAISRLGQLRDLRLQNTHVTRPCRDWREDMPMLNKLDLTNTSVTRLTFEDLQFRRKVLSKVLLEGAPVNMLVITGSDFEKAKHLPFSGAEVILDPMTRFPCDCRMYWTRRIKESFPRALKYLMNLRCTNGELLSDKIPEELVCARLQECAAVGLPKTCACSERPDDDPAQDKQLLRVDCTGAGLNRVPPLPPANNRLYELLLADNQITTVHANDLDNVKTLDLRNNSITKVDDETARRLGSIGGMLRLAGNKLECDCSAAPLLQALRGRAPGRTDLAHVYCSDDTPLSEVPIVDCPPSIAGYVASLVVLSALAVAVTVCLASRERRFFAKAVLHRWGCLCYLNVDEDDRRYDAFVTFSHKDENIVYELMTRLEPPYRLCVHHRDWIPGLRIPDQIVESVRESRRTLALVSQHFLASSWARAEFREAHEAAMLDARPRLVVILLEDPAALALDEQLQRYIATHTYLRWGDPWFYHKLAVALPRPRRSPSATTPAPLLPITSRSARERSHFVQSSAVEKASIPLSVMETP